MNSGIYGYLHSRGFIPGLPGVLAPDLSNGGIVRTPGAMAPSAVAPPIPQGVAPLQAAGPPSYAPGGFLRGVDRVLGGPPMSGLTPQNATEARRMGLLNAGIGMLAGASHGNFADALVGGLSGGQAGYQQGIQAGYGQQQEAEKRAVYQALQPMPGESLRDTYARYQRMLVSAAQMGDKGTVAAVGGAIDAMTPLLRGADSKLNLDTPKMRLVNGKPMLTAFDGATNRYIDTAGNQLSGDIRDLPNEGRGSGQPSEVAQFSMLDRATNQFQDIRRNYENRVAPIRPVYDMITQALENAPAAAGGDGSAQVNMMYAFVKAMDAASAVREGELRLVQESSPLISKWNALKAKVGANGVVTSAMLDPEMVRQVQRILQQGATRYEKRMQEYRNNAAGEVQDWNKKVDGRFPLATLNADRLGDVPSQYYVSPTDVAKKYGSPR